MADNNTTQNTSQGIPFFRGEYALVKFSEDPGPGDTTTVWLIDPTKKTMRPFLNEEAFYNWGETPMTIQDADKAGLITTVSADYLNQGNILGDYQLMQDQYGIQPDGSTPQSETEVDTNKLLNRYGKPLDSQLNKAAYEQVKTFLGGLQGDPKSGISDELINKTLNDPTLMAYYTNAWAYGDYRMTDIYRDLRVKQLVQEGNKNLIGAKVIDESILADQFYTTPEGSAIRTNPALKPPPYLLDVDSKLFENAIFDIPSEAYEVLSPPFDWRSPEGKAEMEKIKSAYHDVLLQQLQATTDREKSIADYNYNLFKDEIAKQYNFQLSNNAGEAWNQILQLGEAHIGRGIAGTGMQKETMDRYLRNIRRQDERQRAVKLTQEEQQRREHLLKHGSPAEIAALSEEEKEKFGFKPSSETQQWFSKESLRKQFPDLSDEELDWYAGSVIDPETGLYRSEQAQRTATARIGIEQEKKAYQFGGALYAKSLEEEKAYKEYTKGLPFEKPTPTTPTPTTSTPTSELAPKSYYETTGKSPFDLSKAGEAATQAAKTMEQPGIYISSPSELYKLKGRPEQDYISRVGEKMYMKPEKFQYISGEKGLEGLGEKDIFREKEKIYKIL